MLFMLKLSDWLAVPLRVISRATSWLLIVLMLVILYDVIGRRYFSTGSIRLQELQWHLHGIIAVLSFGWAYLNNVHVRIDLVSERFAPNARLRIELVAIALLLIPFMAALVWYGYDFAMRSYMRGEGSPGGMGLPNRWIIKSMIPLSALLTLIGAVAVFLRVLVALRRPDLLSDPWKAREQ